MTKTNVIIAASPRDVEAEGVSRDVGDSDDLAPVGGRGHVFGFDEIGAALATVPAADPCALVLVGDRTQLRIVEAIWLQRAPQLFVVCAEVPGFRVRFALNNPGIPLVLASLRELVARATNDPLTRVSHVRLPPASAAEVAGAASSPEPRPVLAAVIAWLRSLLCKAGLDIVCDEDTRVADDSDAATPGERDRRRASRAAEADAALSQMLANPEYEADPLCLLNRRLHLAPVEFRLLLLALAPEIDVVFQESFSRLLSDPSRRVGTLGLYAALLGKPVDIRRELTLSGNLVRWRLLEGRGAHSLPAADEPLRLDAAIVEWLLGDSAALEQDARLKRVLRQVAWPGAALIEDVVELRQVATHLQLLQQPVHPARNGARWLLFNGDQTSTWYAQLERAADLLACTPLRVLTERIAALDCMENCETARRLTRLARLSHRPLLLDAARVEPTADNDEALRLLFVEISASRCRAGVICTNVPRFVGLVGNEAVRVAPESCIPQLARRRSLQTATQRLGITLNDELLRTLEQQFPLQADGWERALRLTSARCTPNDTPAQMTPRFIAACQDVAAASLSNLAMRLEPRCELADVVLPSERKQQLWQIVHGVQFARHVLDEWKFGEQLDYGRGVTALFHGPSGTGKTMSALALARELGSQVLRIDLSRVLSKYIGDFEKNFDAVFRDAAQCGAVLLVDEAESVLGKRGEIKDAHDRHSVAEVAYLLTRIETYEGVVVFTTNARQSIDPAFLRRLRFMIEFPRPDVAAREDIWRRCLPKNSHEIDDAAFRQLARKIDMTGGHIRQITLQAAFLAAAAHARINIEHIAQASRAELAKIGLPPISLDIARAA